jgi:hypothetical protein
VPTRLGLTRKSKCKSKSRVNNIFFNYYLGVVGKSSERLRPPIWGLTWLKGFDITEYNVSNTQ